jgi:hypothetical protein
VQNAFVAINLVAPILGSGEGKSFGNEMPCNVGTLEGKSGMVLPTYFCGGFCFYLRRESEEAVETRNRKGVG